MKKAWLYKAAYYGLPVLLILGTALIFNLGMIQTRWLKSGDELVRTMDRVSDRATALEWPDAKSTAQQLDSEWQKLRGRILVSASVAEIEMFDMEMAGLRGAVEREDPALVQAAYRRMQVLWNDIAS